ncbi:putative Pre-mRNA-splicing factor SPP2, partial [Hyaloscypha finlandica]
MSPSKDDPGSGTSTPKIAIKGFSLSSKSSTSKPGTKPLPSSSLGKRPRSHFAAHDDSDSEGENGKTKHESVVAFGDGRAIKHDEKTKEPLVIQRVGNRDWKSEARSRIQERKNLLPEEVQAMRAQQQNGEKKVEGVDVVNSQDGEIKWGLSVRKRPEPAPELDPAPSSTENGTGKDEKDNEVKEEEKPREQTIDEEALAALTGVQKERKGPDLIIRAEPLTEEEAYRRSVATAPDPSTLEDYERVPVEEFGAALLRGMGWNGEEKGKVRDVKRRQNLLGLGARELKDAEELGAWVGKSDVKRLNGGDRGGRGGGRGGERRPRVNEFLREKEVRDQRREERGGGSYRREKERDRDSGRDSGRDRDGHRKRERDR